MFTKLVVNIPAWWKICYRNITITENGFWWERTQWKRIFILSIINNAFIAFFVTCGIEISHAKQLKTSILKMVLMEWLNIRKLFSKYQNFIQPWPAIDWKASNYECFVFPFALKNVLCFRLKCGNRFTLLTSASKSLSLWINFVLFVVSIETTTQNIDGTQVSSRLFTAGIKTLPQTLTQRYVFSLTAMIFFSL